MKFPFFLLPVILLFGCRAAQLVDPASRIPAEERNVKTLGPFASPNLSYFANQLCRVVDISEGTAKGSKKSCRRRLNDFYRSSFDKSATPLQWIDIVMLSCETIPLRDNSSYTETRRSCFRNAFYLGVSPDYSIRGKECDQLEIQSEAGDCYKTLILKELGKSINIKAPAFE